MPPPGAVCPAMVIYGFEIVIWLSNWMVPPTRKTTVRGPLRLTQSRKLFGPLSLRFVTSQTAPPRPPTEPAPPPWAPGNAATGPRTGGGYGRFTVVSLAVAILVALTGRDWLLLALS